MRLLLFVALFMTVSAMPAQIDTSRQVVNDVVEMNSIYRQLSYTPFHEMTVTVNYSAGTIRFLQFPYATKDGYCCYGDSLIVQMLHPTRDSLAIRNYFEKSTVGCTRVYEFMQLLVKNRIVAMYGTGPGDCSDCSTALIVFDEKKRKCAFICKTSGHRCNPGFCYWPVCYDEAKNQIYPVDSIELSKDVLLVWKHNIRSAKKIRY